MVTTWVGSARSTLFCRLRLSLVIKCFNFCYCLRLTVILVYSLGSSSPKWTAVYIFRLEVCLPFKDKCSFACFIRTVCLSKMSSRLHVLQAK